jgi:hypothetical protein
MPDDAMRLRLYGREALVSPSCLARVLLAGMLARSTRSQRRAYRRLFVTCGYEVLGELAGWVKAVRDRGFPLD